MRYAIQGGAACAWRQWVIARGSPRLWLALFTMLYVVAPVCPARGATRLLAIYGETTAVGVETWLRVRLVAQGDENAVAFSLNYATNDLAFVGAAPGSNALAAAWVSNTNGTSIGRVGFGLALAAGQKFSAGTNELLVARFLTLRVTNTAVGFGDSPIVTEVSDTNAAVLSAGFSNGVVAITPMIPPGIVLQPSSQTAYAGTNVILSLTVTGSAPLAFQWRKEAVALPGATAASLILSNVTVRQSGDYQAVVSNPGGSVTSSVAALTILPAPVAPQIVQQPTGRALTVGESAGFTVTASGTGPLGFQWYWNGSPLAGQTNTALSITNAQPAQAGTYTVVVSNFVGTVTSDAAVLTVSSASRMVRVVNQLAGANGFVEVPVELVALGEEAAAAFSLQFDPASLWFAGAALGSGAPGAQLQVNSSQVNSGRVGVAVASGMGGAFPAGTVEFVRLRFQVVGGVGERLLAMTDGPVWREVADVFGQARPAVFSNGVVTVVGPPVIVGQPQGASLPVLRSYTLSVTATGAPPLAYQWRLNGANLPGASSSQLQLSAIQASQAGIYTVLVTNLGGATLSADAAIAVSRVVSVSATNTVVLGGNLTATISLLAAGDENAVGFTFRFDPGKFRLLDWQRGADLTNATVGINTNDVDGGALGLVVALPGLNTLLPGSNSLLTVRLAAIETAAATTLGFADVPVVCELAAANAEVLLSAFADRTVAIRGDLRPVLSISRSGNAIAISWSPPGDYSLQWAPSPLGPWTQIVGATNPYTAPIIDRQRFYRLAQ